MRSAIRLLPLILAVSGLCAAPSGPAWAEDEVPATEGLLEALQERIARLESEVVALKGRVAWLEAQLAAERGAGEASAPGRVRATATATVEVRPRPALPGHWTLDADATWEAMADRQAADATDPAEAAMIREVLHDAFQHLQMEVWIEAEGSWRVRVVRPDGGRETARGTFTKQEDGTWRFVTTHQDGIEQAEPVDRLAAHLDDEGRLVLEESASDTVLIFVR